MASLWRFRELKARHIAARVWREIFDDDVFGQAAKLSFYFLLALFPLLLFLTTVFGYFAQSEDLRASLLEYFRRVVPRSAFRLVTDTLEQVSAGASGKTLSIGILATLWAASNGMAALAKGLNAAYEVEEGRPWWKARLIAVGLTIAFAVFTAVSLALIIAGGSLGAFVADSLGMKDAFVAAWNVLRWPVALFFVLMAVNLLYRFAPDLRQRKWRWMTPGAVLAVTLWLLASIGFRLYLRWFNSYNATYGSLGAVIILLLWFYLTSAAILIGAELDSELENAAARAGDPDSRLPGEKEPGERRRSRLMRLIGGRMPRSGVG